MNKFLQQLAAWFPKAGINAETDTPTEAAAKLEPFMADLKTAGELAAQMASLNTVIDEMKSQFADLQTKVTANADAANANFTSIKEQVTALQTEVATQLTTTKNEVSAAIAGMKTTAPPKPEDKADNDVTLDEKKATGNVVKFAESDWKRPTSKIRTTQVPPMQ